MSTLSISKKELSEVKQLIHEVTAQVVASILTLSTWVWERINLWFNQALEDYALENIKQEGVTGIWIRRAALFFGVEEEVVKTNIKRFIKPKKSTVKKLVFLPVYLLITLIDALYYRRKSLPKSQKINKKVNSYKE